MNERDFERILSEGSHNRNKISTPINDTNTFGVPEVPNTKSTKPGSTKAKIGNTGKSAKKDYQSHKGDGSNAPRVGRKDYEVTYSKTGSLVESFLKGEKEKGGWDVLKEGFDEARARRLREGKKKEEENTWENNRKYWNEESEEKEPKGKKPPKKKKISTEKGKEKMKESIDDFEDDDFEDDLEDEDYKENLDDEDFNDDDDDDWDDEGEPQEAVNYEDLVDDGIEIVDEAHDPEEWEDDDYDIDDEEFDDDWDEEDGLRMSDDIEYEDEDEDWDDDFDEDKF